MMLIATEDALSEAAAIRIVEDARGSKSFALQCVGQQGNGFLKKNFPRYLLAAKQRPVFMLTDLDHLECAPVLRKTWLQEQSCPSNFVFRIAVREVESWLLADREAFSEYLKISTARVSADPEKLSDPKRHVLDLAKKCPRDLRADLLPKKGAIASTGLGYNARLCEFVRTQWSLDRAQDRSESLARARKALSHCIQSYYT